MAMYWKMLVFISIKYIRASMLTFSLKIIVANVDL